jgi:hypothetical protein
MRRLASRGSGDKQAADLEGQHGGIKIGRWCLGRQGDKGGVGLNQPSAPPGIFRRSSGARGERLRKIENRLNAVPICARADKAGELAAPGHAAVTAS